MNYFFASIILCSFVTVFGQYPINGTCPEICKPFDLNVTLDQLLGIWFLQISIPYRYEIDAKCTYINITEIINSTNTFHETQVYRNKITNEVIFLEGWANFTSDGYLTHHFDIVDLQRNVKIIALTPEYFIVISCHECGPYQKDGAGIYAKVFTRSPHLDCGIDITAIEILEKCGIPQSYLKIHDHSNCNSC